MLDVPNHSEREKRNDFGIRLVTYKRLGLVSKFECPVSVSAGDGFGLVLVFNVSCPSLTLALSQCIDGCLSMKL